MRRQLFVWMAVLVGSACEALPVLPSESGERLPTQLLFTGLTLAEGTPGAGDAVANDAILAGTAVQAGVTVLDQASTPLAGALVQFGLRAEGWRTVFELPQGASCVTNEDGACSIVLSNEGRADAVTLEMSVPGVAPLTEQLVVQPDASKVVIDVEVEGLGRFNWSTGSSLDPLAGEGTLLSLDRDRAGGQKVQLRLSDRFGNALPDRSVRLAVLQDGEEPPAADAGPWVDAGVSDAAADGGVLDTGPVDDAGAGDTGRRGDAGMKPLSLQASARRARVGAPNTDGECVSSPQAAAEDERLSDAQGLATFCVLPGEELGRWTLSVNPVDLFAVGEATSMALAGETRAGAPEQIRYVVPEGRNQARLWCRAGQLSGVAVFRVENQAGPVPNVRVALDAEGGLDGLSTRLQETDETGSVRVEAICPRRLLTGGRIVARLAERADVPPASVAVEVIANAVARIEISRHGDWPDPVRSGAEVGIRVRAFDADDLPVVRTGLPPDGDVEDTREPLQLRLSMASVGHAQALQLADSGDPLISELVTINPETGAADVSVRITSRATYANPIVLRAQPEASQVYGDLAISVVPGAPARLVVNPAGVVEALLGGSAGELTYTVLDGEGDEANAVPGVPVQITAPQSLVLEANWSNAQTLTGTTGPDGRFRVSVLRANEVGEALVTGTLQTEGGPVSTTTRVQVGEGAAASLHLLLDGIPMVLQDGQPTLTLRAGTPLRQALTLTLLNAQGAGLPGRGVSIDLEAGDQATCAEFAEAGVTDQTGTITYGQGGLALTAGGNVGTCVYRVAHGDTPARARLRVVQIPGPPVIATLTAAQSRVLSNSLAHVVDGVEVTLSARDANNLAPEGLRMWLEYSNCQVNRTVVTLDAQGEAAFVVGGGADPGVDCVLRARYANEVDAYVTRSANGRAAREDDTPDQLARLTTHLVFATGGFVGPGLTWLSFGEGAADNRSFSMTRNGSSRWTLRGTNLIYPDNFDGGLCNQPEACTMAEIVRMRRREDGGYDVVVDDEGAAQVIAANLPLRYDIRDNSVRGLAFDLPHSRLADGGLLGFRLKHPGDDGAASRAIEFLARRPWRNAGTSLRLSDADPDFAIRGGAVMELHGAGQPELLLCGVDREGGWFSVVALGAGGALPAEPAAIVRSWSGREGYPDVGDENFGCTTGFVDGDEHLDLMVLASPDDGYPRVVVHPGVPGPAVFSAEGTELVWRERSARDPLMTGIRFRPNPPALQVIRTDAQERRARGLSRRLLLREEGGRYVTGGVIAVPGSDRIADERRVNLTQSLLVLDGRLYRGAQYATLGFAHRSRNWALGWAAQERIVLAELGLGWSVFDPQSGAYERYQGCVAFQTSLALHGQLFVCHDDRAQRLAVFDVRTGALRYELPYPTRGLVHAPADPQHIYTAHAPNVLKVWRAETGQLVRTHELTRLNRLEYDGQILPENGWLHASALPTGQSVGNYLINPSSSEFQSTNLSPYQYVQRNPFLTRQGSLFRLDGQHFFKLNRFTNTESRAGIIRGQSRGVTFNSDLGELVGVDVEVDSSRGWLVRSREVADNGARWAELAVMTNDPSPCYSHYHRNSFCIDHYLRVPMQINQHRVQFSDDGQSMLVIGQPYSTVHARNEVGEFELEPLRNVGKPLMGQAHRRQASVFTHDNHSVSKERYVTWRPGCGNGVIDDGELFDNGQPWEPSTEYHITCGATCGDGVVHQGEACDDGNNDAGDGCSRLCQVE